MSAIDWRNVQLITSFMVEQDGFAFDPGGGLNALRGIGDLAIHYAITDDRAPLCGSGGGREFFHSLSFALVGNEKPFRVTVCKKCRDAVKKNVAHLNREKREAERPLEEVRDLQHRAREVASLLWDALDYSAPVEPFPLGSHEARPSVWGEFDRKTLHRRLDEAIDRHNSFLAQAEAKLKEIEEGNR